MSCSILNDFSFQSHDLTIMLTIIHMGHETYVANRERDLLEELKLTMQQPPIWPFHKFDIHWLLRLIHEEEACKPIVKLQ
jgi:hypothetical protein